LCAEIPRVESSLCPELSKFVLVGLNITSVNRKTVSGKIGAHCSFFALALAIPIRAHARKTAPGYLARHTIDRMQ